MIALVTADIQTGVVTTGAFRYVSTLVSGQYPDLCGTDPFYRLHFSLLHYLWGSQVFYNTIASYEEKLLEARFGEEYSRYQKRTGSGFRK